MSDHAWIVVHTGTLLVLAALLLLTTRTTQAELILLNERLSRVESGNMVPPVPVASTAPPETAEGN